MSLFLATLSFAGKPKVSAARAKVIVPDSTPSSGTISPATPTISYTAGPFAQANQSPLGLGQLDTGPRCNAAFPCDNYTLHVTIPPEYLDTHCFPSVKITLSWVDTGTGQSDYDLYIYNGTNPTLDGNHAADYQSTSSGYVPEVAIVSPLTADGQPHDYTVVIVPFQPTGETVNVKIELLPGPPPGAPSCGTPGFGSPDPTAPGVPRFQTFVAPAGTSAEAGNGEFNIGFNPHTGRIMTMNSGPVWRLTPPEILAQAKPECCEALWEDESSIVADIGLDPILWTDQKTGRTFAANSTTGANPQYAYTDSDGDPTVTAPTGWTPFGVAAPNGGADHETLGSGPYPSSLSVLNTPVNQGEALYYCSQDIVGPAACYRSDTLGSSFGPSVLAYTGQGPGVPGGTCGGLHGHIHVAPDGTAWLPVNQCSGLQGGVFSTDGGVTWTTFTVPNAISQQQGADPSIAIDANNTIYYAYVNNEPVSAGNLPEGHARVAVGNRVGNTINWVNDIDLGATHGMRNAAEIEAVGGSTGRAAIGFLGTDRPGDYQAKSFAGKWYAFIATTYNTGASWNVVNATPNDPVQSVTGIWQQGGGAIQRNLLDFNEITIDDKGRVLYGYSDGCVSPECIAGTGANDYTAFMRVARQTGGKTLLASYDGNTDTTTAILPKAPCLSGIRDTTGSHLTWKAPDNGGSVILKYEIWRSVTSNTEVKIGESIITKFDDTSALANVPDYFYKVKAVNAVNVGPFSNEIDLPIVIPPPPPNPCVLAGVSLLTDGANDLILPTGVQSNPGWDVRSLAMSEPFAYAPNKLVFTLKMQDLSTVPPNTRWPITFTGPDNVNYTVRMTNVATDGATTVPIFQYGPTAGPFVTADAASNFTPDGTITIVVPSSGVGVTAPGQQLIGFLVRISTVVPVFGTLTPDNMPDSLAPAGTYSVVGNAFCTPNTAPLANLVAHLAGTLNPPEGDPPLAIDFDGSGSTDADAGDVIASYTFNFGDGSPAVTRTVAQFGATAAFVSHTYTSNGGFAATLTVTDSHGKVSSNTALLNIEVDLPMERVVSDKLHGGTAYSVVLYDRSIYPNGNGEIECRNDTNYPHTIIYTFDPAFTVTGAASNVAISAPGGASVGTHGPGPGPNQYTVQLTNVANAQHLFVTLNGVPVHNNTSNANATLNDAGVRMDVLIGDVNGVNGVSGSDVNICKAQVGVNVSAANFRSDVNATGSISGSDVNLVKAQVGTSLP